VGSSACFHADQASLPVRCEAQQLQARKLLSHDDLSVPVHACQMENCFAKTMPMVRISTNWSPLPTSHTQLLSNSGGGPSH